MSYTFGFVFVSLCCTPCFVYSKEKEDGEEGETTKNRLQTRDT